MNGGRRLVVRGRRRYWVCRVRARVKRCSFLLPDSCRRRATAWLPLTTFILVVLIAALAIADPGLLPRDRPDGPPLASVPHYSFDDFASAQR